MNEKLKLLSFKQNFSWSLISSLFFAFSQWLIVSFLAKFGNAEMVGLYSLGLAITAPVFLLLSMNLRVVVATDSMRKWFFSDYLWFRVFTSFFSVGIIVLITLLLNYSLYYKMVIILIALIKLVESISDICYGKFQQVENLRLIAISKLWRAFFSILAFYISLYLFNELIYALIAQLTLWFVVLVKYDLKIIIRDLSMDNIKRIIQIEKVKSLAILSLPLGISGTLDSLNTNIPRYFISYFQDERALGIYAGITYIMLVGQTVITALSQVTIPRFSQYYIKDKSKFKNLLSKLLIISMLLGLLGIIISFWLGDFILLNLYSEEYLGYKDIFVMSMIAAVFWYSSGFLNAAIVSTRKFKVQVPIFLFTTIMTLLVSFLLIPRFGLFGATLSLIIGHVTRFILATIILKRIF